jgi:5-deoxy-glucuronate isomerase
MAVHLKGREVGFDGGVATITRAGEPADDTGITVQLLELGAGESFETTSEQETAWLLMMGAVAVTAGEHTAHFERRSLFDEAPSAVHVPAGTRVRLQASAPTEFTVYATPNTKPFPVRLFTPADVPNEHRGKGQVGGACYRFVRTIFDDSASDPNTDLVLGEVVTFPGRWSSYPPHHHPQPEIYHYRFTDPRGFGFAQLGPDVVTVRDRDTIKIFAPNDHAQVAAPGYGMYYAWVIRHLPGNRYRGFEFTPDHVWTTEPDADFWQPREAGGG